MTAAPTTLATLQSSAVATREQHMPAVKAGFFDLQSFELMQRIAKGFASSTLVPQQYQGNIANCMIALNMAQRIGADPMQVMQSLVIVHGRPTWAAQFLIATANACGRFSALRFEFFGEKNTDSWGCRAYAIERDTNEKLYGSDVTIGIAKAEGWYNKNGSKWKTMPQQMLMYRAGGWWVRVYAPELSMGLQTQEEAVDLIDITPRPAAADLSDLRGTAPATVITDEIGTPDAAGEPQTEQQNIPENIPEGDGQQDKADPAGDAGAPAAGAEQRELSPEEQDYQRTLAAEQAAGQAKPAGRRAAAANRPPINAE